MHAVLGTRVHPDTDRRLTARLIEVRIELENPATIPNAYIFTECGRLFRKAIRDIRWAALDEGLIDGGLILAAS